MFPESRTKTEVRANGWADKASLDQLAEAWASYPCFPHPFMRHLIGRWNSIQSNLAQVDTLISQGDVSHSHEGFRVLVDGKLHHFLDSAEQDTQRCGINRDRPPFDDEINRYDVQEHWLQLYVKENGRRFGLSRLRGPHDTGPDLTGYRKSQYVHVEVEVHWKHWFEHNHHKQPDFEDVDLLIVLNPSRKRCKRRNLLPPEIRNIDTEHFKSWIASSFPRCSPLEELKNLARRRYIASLLHSMWEEHITSHAPVGLLRSVIEKQERARVFFSHCARHALPRGEATSLVLPLAQLGIVDLRDALIRAERHIAALRWS